MILITGATGNIGTESTLSEVIGSPIQCIDIPTELAAERMKASGIPEMGTRIGHASMATKSVLPRKANST